MRLKIPFYEQKGKNDCGPISLKMVLKYFGETHSIKKLKKFSDSKKNETTWTIGLAKTAAQLGFKTEFYTLHMELNPKNFELEYYQKKSGGKSLYQSKTEKLHKEATKFGVIKKEKTLTLNKLLSKINKDCIAMVLLNWNIIKRKEGYQGHFVPIAGYDKNKIYIHNPGPKNPQEFQPISKKLFDKARKSKGTDEDIIYIHRKQ